MIAPGSKVIGEILGPTPVRVAGELGGRIRVDQTVRVDPNGQVQGDIHAREVYIGGRVEGNVQGTEKVVLGATGHLEGDVRAPRVIIEEGAFLKGEVEMGSSAPSPAARRQAAPPSQPSQPSRPAPPSPKQPSLPDTSPDADSEPGTSRPEKPGESQ